MPAVETTTKAQGENDWPEMRPPEMGRGLPAACGQDPAPMGPLDVHQPIGPAYLARCAGGQLALDFPPDIRYFYL